MTETALKNVLGFGVKDFIEKAVNGGFVANFDGYSKVKASSYIADGYTAEYRKEKEEQPRKLEVKCECHE